MFFKKHILWVVGTVTVIPCIGCLHIHSPNIFFLGMTIGTVPVLGYSQVSTSIMLVLRLISMFVLAFNGAEAYNPASQNVKGNAEENHNQAALLEVDTKTKTKTAAPSGGDSTGTPNTPPAPATPKQAAGSPNPMWGLVSGGLESLANLAKAQGKTTPP